MVSLGGMIDICCKKLIYPKLPSLSLLSPHPHSHSLSSFLGVNDQNFSFNSFFFSFRELLDFSKTAWVQDAFNKEFKASGGPLLFLDERRTLKSKSGKHFVCKGRLSDGTEVYRHHVITAKIGTNQICDFWHLEKTCNSVLKRRKLEQWWTYPPPSQLGTNRLIYLG